MPKSVNGLWKEIISFENLLAAHKEARKGKKFKGDVLQFGYNLEENLLNIQNHLIWKSWTPGKHCTFYVYDPKKRLISAPSFEDRVVHHALVRIIEPLFEKKFVFDSYACRKGKGIHAATLRLQSFLRKANKNWRNIYVLKADISKYFPSINRQRLLEILKRTIKDKDVLWLCERIIKQSKENTGIPVGALTSQLFANIYLDTLDHFIKDDLGVKFYIRYMDDFVILKESKSELWELLHKIEEFLMHQLYLILNPKTSIFPAVRGVDFAGYRTWATHILPRKRNVKRARKRFKRFAKAYAQGKIDLEYIRPRVMSFLGYMKHCSSYITLKYFFNKFMLKKYAE